MKTVFLIIATVLTLLSAVPYIRDILKGSTKPNIVSWSTWTLLTGIATVAAFSAREYTAAIFTGVAAIETLFIVLIGLRYGYAKYTRFDTICQLSAIIGIVLWQVFNSPAIAVLASVAIDFIGAMPTLRHAWVKPHEETWSTFLIAGVGAIFGFMALSNYNLVNVPYAAYLIVINLLMTAIILKRS